MNIAGCIHGAEPAIDYSLLRHVANKVNFEFEALPARAGQGDTLDARCIWAINAT